MCYGVLSQDGLFLEILINVFTLMIGLMRFFEENAIIFKCKVHAM